MGNTKINTQTPDTQASETINACISNVQRISKELKLLVSSNPAADTSTQLLSIGQKLSECGRVLADLAEGKSTVKQYEKAINPKYYSGEKKFRYDNRGSISQSKNGDFRVEYFVCGVRAKVKSFKSREDAEAYRETIINCRDKAYKQIEDKKLFGYAAKSVFENLLLGKYTACSAHSEVDFYTYCNKYMEFVFKKGERSRLRLSTVADYKGYCNNHIKTAAISVIPLSALSSDDFAGFIDELYAKTLSDKTIHNIITFCKAVLTFASKDNLVSCNQNNWELVFIDIGTGKPQQNEKQSQFYTEDEAALIIKAGYSERFINGLLLDFYINTGVRRGEALGLHFVDIDFKTGIAFLQRSVCREQRNESLMGTSDDGKPKTIVNLNAPLKTRCSKRRVTLTSGLLANIIKAQNEAKEKYQEAYSDDMSIFTDDNGEVIKPDYVDTILKNACSKAGVKKLRVHDLRHSCITMLANNSDFTMKQVQEYARHANFTLTVNIQYGHI